MRGIAHRYDGVDDWFEPPVSTSGRTSRRTPVMMSAFCWMERGSQHGRSDAGPFEYQLAEVQRGRAEVAADDDQLAVGCQAVQVADEVIGADHVEDGIDAAAVGGCDEVVGAAVDCRRCAGALADLGLGVAAGGGDDCCSGGGGPLDGERDDAAAGAVDQDVWPARSPETMARLK